MASFNNQLVIVSVYVDDDLVIGCKEEAQVLKVKKLLGKNFPATDKGPLHHYLGIEIEREGDTGTITMSQSQYIKDLLKVYGMGNCKPIATPLEANHQVSCSKDECELIDQHLTITTRPDILHSVSKLSQRNSEPHTEHMQAAKRILRYLRGTIDMKISYQAGENSMNGYVDADWGGNALDRKLFTGFIFYVGGSPISWESRKQSCVALSSTEVEYMVMSDAAKEAIFLRRLLMEIGYSSGEPFLLNIDNQSAEKFATNPVYHKRTKHIDIRFHHVREVIRNNEMVLRYCTTENMIAHILTKNLSKAKHLRFMKLMKFI